MMEFTLSRVAVFICGAVLLAAVVAPIADYYDNKESQEMKVCADSLSSMIDSFWESEADTMTVRGWDILPSSGYVIEAEGHILKVSDGNRTYMSDLEFPTEGFMIGYGDIIVLERNNGALAQIQ